MINTANQNTLLSRITDSEWDELSARLSLSKREKEVLWGIMSDLTEMAIGRQLGISQHTVHTYTERLYRKLKVQSRVQLIVDVFGVYCGLITEEPS